MGEARTHSAGFAGSRLERGTQGGGLQKQQKKQQAMLFCVDKPAWLSERGMLPSLIRPLGTLRATPALGLVIQREEQQPWSRGHGAACRAWCSQPLRK